MLTRRFFLQVLPALMLLPLGGGVVVAAKPRKRAAAQDSARGPHSLGRLEWPPSMSPDYLGVGERGYAVLGDNLGRLAIVDLKREDSPSVVGEIGGIGRRIVAASVGTHRAYVLGVDEEEGEERYVLALISLVPASEPTLLAKVPLDQFREPAAIASDADVLAVAGAGRAGENQVIIYSGGSRRKSAAVQPLSTLVFDEPVRAVALQDRQLVAVLRQEAETLLEVVNLSNPRIPQKLRRLRLNGDFALCATARDMVLLGGENDSGRHELQLVLLRPLPRVARTVDIPEVTAILDGAHQKGQFLLLVNRHGRQAVLPIALGRGAKTQTGEPVLLPTGSLGPGSKARIAATAREAYVATDGGSVQVLTLKRGGWEYLYSHTIPRLPASTVALNGKRCVLAGGDLKVYNLSTPESPVLVESVAAGGTVRAMVTAGDFLLVLTREALTLRYMERPADVIASLKASANGLVFDAVQKRAYLLTADGETKTTVQSLHIGSSSLTAGEPFDLPAAFRRASAHGGKLMLGSVSELTCFSLGQPIELVGKRAMPNLAVRDLQLTRDYALVTAVDENSRGFLLVLPCDKQDLNTAGSVNLPQDGAALAVAGGTAVVVGRASSGDDTATVVDISNAAQPRAVASFKVVEAAAAVAIQNNLAVVGGRGIEVLSLV